MLPLLLSPLLTTPAEAQQVTPFQYQLYKGGLLLGEGKQGCLNVRAAAAMARAGNGPSGPTAGWDENLLRDLKARCGIR
jgi:hypothetical protein